MSDQLMKKELILQGMGWGHMPDHLVADELRSGQLLSIAGRYFLGVQGDMVAARLRNVPHGPIAERLWQFIASQAPILATGRTSRPKPWQRSRRKSRSSD
jgi:DNA-binding transcriptional LysR family regulator